MTALLYFVIGFLLAVIAIRVDRNEMGIAVVMVFAWPLALPFCLLVLLLDFIGGLGRS